MAEIDAAFWRLGDLLRQVAGTPSPQVTGRCVKTDPDGTAWVEVQGNPDPVPVDGGATTYGEGDDVTLSMDAGVPRVTSNVTSPAASTGMVRKALAPVARLAKDARAIAEATGQYFWHDDNGAHVSTEQDNPTGERNILMNSLGILLRQGSAWLASFSDSAVAFYDGLGNTAANIVAQFGADGAVIGRSGESHMELDYHSMRMIDREGVEYFEVEDLRDESGTLEVTDTFESDGESRVYVLTFTATGTDYTVTVSDGSGGTVTKETTKVTFGTYPTVGAIIAVTYTTASELAKSYTFGRRDSTADVGAMSVAEGLDTAASGRQSHASGNLTTASGTNSYAGGARTTASGRNSRATGEDTTASGWGSHADGLHTVAGSNYQTAIGRWNDNDPNNAFEVGNGVSGARSNAFAVDWDGYLYPMNEQMPDWVFAQGTSGIWTYRKWHSGVSECWGTYTASIAVDIASASYGGYRSNQTTAAWPTGTFVAAPTVTATLQSGAGVWVSNTADSSASAAKFILSCGASMTAASRSVAIHACGRWK